MKFSFYTPCPRCVRTVELKQVDPSPRARVLPADRPLFSNREIAARFEVNYQTAHRLVQELVAEGRLERRLSSGTFIAAASSAASTLNASGDQRTRHFPLGTSQIAGIGFTFSRRYPHACHAAKPPQILLFRQLLRQYGRKCGYMHFLCTKMMPPIVSLQRSLICVHPILDAYIHTNHSYQRKTRALVSVDHVNFMAFFPPDLGLQMQDSQKFSW